ncbi:hypothetical protein [Actinomadura kijaniata]|uniref:hypothetical protein n=1 Tax=Actinomadura kijaniata TaxID=46161 RepID=UPI000834821A|nr:hypothetical protein [Actinomadura kijaniata]
MSVPRWAVWAAYAAPSCVLPSSLWRVREAFRDSACMAHAEPWEPYYIVGLSAVSLGAALLTVGLVRPWGEVFPRWIPGLGGRRVPVLAAVVPALVGAALLIALIGYGLFLAEPNNVHPDCPPPKAASLVGLCYAPLVAWPFLLIAVTVAYHRRRTSAGASPAPRP